MSVIENWHTWFMHSSVVFIFYSQMYSISNNIHTERFQLGKIHIKESKTASLKVFETTLYWVEQKIHLGFSIPSYRKPEQAFWSTQYCISLTDSYFPSFKSFKNLLYSSNLKHFLPITYTQYLCFLFYLENRSNKRGTFSCSLHHIY